ncbi:MAG: CHAT domain-containing protein [Leptolyngbyaceae cyanobacterium]
MVKWLRLLAITGVLGGASLLAAASDPQAISASMDGDSICESQSAEAETVASDTSRSISASSPALHCEIFNSSLYETDSGFRASVDEIVSPYLGKTVSAAHLKVIKDDITLQYLQRDYVTSWAEIVEILDDGTLKINVVEGVINDVRVGVKMNSKSNEEQNDGLNEEKIVYIPAGLTQDNPVLVEYLADEKGIALATFEQGEYIFNALKSALRDSQGQPLRPINLEQLNEALNRISDTTWFAREQVSFRLRAPRQSEFEHRLAQQNPFANEYAQYLEERLAQLPAGESPERDQLLQQKERVAAGAPILPFSLEVVEPGASVLEIDIDDPIEGVVEAEDIQSSLLDVRFDFSTLSLDIKRKEAFEEHFGSEFERTIVKPSLIRFALHSLELQEPSIRAAVVYIASDGDRVSIRVETAYNEPILVENITRYQPKELPEEFSVSEAVNFVPELEAGETVSKNELVLEVERFWREVQNPNSGDYLATADRLYDLLIRPVEEQFEAMNAIRSEADQLTNKGIDVNTFLFVMEEELGLLPISALYDSQKQQFLAEKYKVGIIPNFQSLDVRPSNLDRADLLAMGTSEFTDPELFKPLSAVPLELRMLEDIWSQESSDRTQVLENEDFTLANVRQQRQEYPYQIVHLATHTRFRRGRPGDSDIQFSDTSLPLNDLQVATLNWNDPPVELLVLSACQTALGNPDAELGFAGLSLQANVKSVLASLWTVSDMASLMYMMEFYRALRTGVTKAEAVQHTQRAMLDEQRMAQNLKELYFRIRSIKEDEQYLEHLSETEVSRLNELSTYIEDEQRRAEVAADLTHPHYWSTYTLVGSPW